MFFPVALTEHPQARRSSREYFCGRLQEQLQSGQRTLPPEPPALTARAIAETFSPPAARKGHHLRRSISQLHLSHCRKFYGLCRFAVQLGLKRRHFLCFIAVRVEEQKLRGPWLKAVWKTSKREHIKGD